MSARAWKLAAVAAAALTLAGCVRGCTSSKPPIHLNPSMDDQPKLLPQSESTFFYDGSAMRPPVPGTVARGELRESTETFEGKGPDGKFITTIPVHVDEQVLDRGKQRYAIYCAPCHDVRGDGHGILYQRGKIPTASLHDEKIVKYPDGQLYDIITNGSGLMPAYRWPISPSDRWAIVAYVREMERKRAASSEPDLSAAK